MAEDGLIDSDAKAHPHGRATSPPSPCSRSKASTMKASRSAFRSNGTRNGGRRRASSSRPSRRTAAARTRAPGIGDRVLARLTPEEETGGFVARVIKVLERQPPAALGIFRERRGEARIIPIDRRGNELTVSPEPRRARRTASSFRSRWSSSGRFGLPAGARRRAARRCFEREGDQPDRARGARHSACLSRTPCSPPRRLPSPPTWRIARIGPSCRSSPSIRADARDHDDAVHAEPDPENPERLSRDRRDRRRRLLRAPRLCARPRSGEARQLRLLSRPRRADAAGAHLQRPLLAASKASPARPSPSACASAPTARSLATPFHRVMMRSAAKLSYEQAQAAIDGRPDVKTDAVAQSDPEAALGGLWRACARARPARAACDRHPRAQGGVEDGRFGRPHRRPAASRRAPADRRVHDPGERRRRRDAGSEDEARSSTASTTSRHSKSSTRSANSSARST